MSLDPIGGHLSNPQSFNRYAYVRNDPINATDSTGMVCDMGCDDGDDGGGGGGGATGAPCGPFECSGDSQPDPTPDPDPNDLPDAPEPKPDVLQNNNASADLDFVFNGANQTLQPSNDLTDLSALNLPTTTGSVTLSGATGGIGGGDDVLVDMDLWHNSAQCQGCGTMWRQADTTGKALFIGTGIAIAGPAIIGELATMGTMQVAVMEGEPFHVAFGADGTMVHAAGETLGDMTIEQLPTRFFTMNNIPIYNIPVLNPGVVVPAIGSAAASCVTSACMGFLRGWVPF
jgi:hypothetical protein